METNMIGEKIAKARKKAGLSQAQLGEQLFISPQAVGKWERGESIPDIITINKLAKILGVELNYFSDNNQASDEETVPHNVSHSEQRVEENDAQSQDSPGQQLLTNFSGSALAETDFAGVIAHKRKFNGSALHGSDFSGADLTGSSFKTSDASGARFD